jgi:TatD DNase family protein
MSGHAWFETHAHVCDAKFDSDRAEVLERAFQNGVKTLVEIGEGPAEWDKALQLSDAYAPSVFWALGLHPYYADQLDEKLWARLKQMSTHPRLVAVGEIGLDYAKCSIPPETQKKSLRSMIEFALEIKKPLIIHCRDAYPDLLPLLRTYFQEHKMEKDRPGVIHCFSGDKNEAEELVNMGFFLGIDGPLTYPNSKKLREAVADIPLDHLVLETDCPYLPPQDFRGQRNEPGYIPLIGRFLASLRGISEEELASTLTRNSFSLFRLKPLSN